MKVWMIAVLALGWSLGCDPAGSEDSFDFWSVPDLNGMGKADGRSQYSVGRTPGRRGNPIRSERGVCRFAGRTHSG